MPVQGAGWVGDYAEDYATLNLKFTTLTTSWVPVALLGTPVVKVYTGSATGTEVTTGVTLAVDFDGVVGLNNVLIDLSSAAFYAVGADYHVIITTGTIDSVSAVGVVVGSFSIENRKSKADVIEWLGTAVGAGTAGVPNVDVTRISNDATAADNLELQYDTTGLTGDTFPSSQAQVGSIGASAGGALNFEANADNSGGTIDPGSTAFVGNETNNFTDTDRENGTRHIITDATNVIDLVYGFSVGGDKTATEMIFKGFANANGDDLTISAWDHPGSEWETLGTLAAKNSTSNITVTEALLSKHTGTGSEIGKVYIRFNGSGLSASADLNTDQILIEAVVIGQSVGYAGGQIWVNTALSNTSTENFVDGVADNPVSTIAAAKTLSTSLSLPDFHIINGSSITLAESTVSESYFGDNWTLALGSQDVGGGFFQGADVTGTGTGSVEVHFSHCEIGDVTVADAHFDDCDIEGTVTLSAAANYNFVNCSHSGTTATIDFGSGVGNTTVHLHNYHGAITVKNMGQSSSTDVLHFSSSNGKLTLDSTCIAGTVNLNGTFDLVNNGSGQTLNRNGDAINVIGAVKTTTDKFVFTNTNEVDANTKSINDAEVVGDGNATPWDGA